MVTDFFKRLFSTGSFLFGYFFVRDRLDLVIQNIDDVFSRFFIFSIQFSTIKYQFKKDKKIRIFLYLEYDLKPNNCLKKIEKKN